MVNRNVRKLPSLSRVQNNISYAALQPTSQNSFMCAEGDFLLPIFTMSAKIRLRFLIAVQPSPYHHGFTQNDNTHKIFQESPSSKDFEFLPGF